MLPIGSTRCAILAALLIALLAVVVGSQQHPSLASFEGPATETQATVGLPAGAYEVTERRSANAKHYALPDGSFRMILTPEGMPQHWWDGSSWRDFDLTFRPVPPGEANGGFPFTCQDNGMRTWVIPQSPLGEVVRVEHGGLSMVWSPLQIGQEGHPTIWGASLPVVPAGSVVAIDYAGSGGVRSVYTLMRSGLKHDVVLPHAPADSPFGGANFVISWLVMIEGANAVVGDGGIDLRGGGETASVLVVGPDGRGGLRIPEPVIEDGAGRKFVDRDTGARYRVLHHGGDLFAIELHVPMAWLSAAERVWPVLIDPSVNVNHGTPCMAPLPSSMGCVDNGAWAGGFTDVNWDRNPIGGCTNQNDARTFAFARFPAASGLVGGGLIYKCRAYCRFSSVGNDSAWDWVVSQQPPGSTTYFDLCALTTGTASINQAVWNRISSSSLVGGQAGSMSSYVSQTYASTDWTTPFMQACGFPTQPIEMAWRALPVYSQSGCAEVSTSTSHTFLEVHYTAAGSPATPTLTLAGRTDTSLTVNRTSVSNATEYLFELHSNSTFGPPPLQSSGWTANAQWQFTGLTPSTLYWVRVTARNAISTMAPGAAASWATLPSTPVTLPATSITGSGFTANWQSAAGATSYEVEVRLGLWGQVLGTYQSSGISVAVSGLSSGVGYAFAVRAENSTTNLTSPWSQPRAVSTTSAPGAPSGFDLHSFAGTSCTASWNAIPGADYEVAFGTVDPPVNSTTTTSTSHSFTGLQNGTTYHGRVRARVGGVWGNWSSSDSGSTIAAPFPPTTLPASNVAANSFTARWNSASNATNYRVDVSTSPAFSSYVDPFWDFDAGNGLQVAVTGLGPNTTYYYRVRAWTGDAGPSGNSDVRSVTTSPGAPSVPSAPNALPASNVTITSFVANWSAVASATGYRLDVSTNPQFTGFVPGFQNRDVGSANFCLVDSLVAGGTYYYQVRAVNSAGSSSNSNSRTVALTQNAAPSLASLTPAMATQGTPGVFVALTGSGFIPSSIARWNGTDLVTEWMSPTELRVTVPGVLLATIGTASITVFNPAPGGGTSDARTFTIVDPAMVPPTDLRVTTSMPGPGYSLAWAPPPDYATASHYVLRRYTTPDRSGVPATFSLSNFAATAQVTVGDVGAYWFDLVVVRGAGVQSLPTRLVKVAFTTSRASGDVNGDRFVDARDLMDVIVAFDAHAGDFHWNPSADCNGDGVVNGSDALRVTTNLGTRL